MSITLKSVLTVVPARNEQALIGDCLAAVQSARRHLLRTHPNLHSHVVVVADRCTDLTSSVAASFPGVQVVHSDAGRVGTARAAGVHHGLTVCGVPWNRLWIANTDADSVVPRDWLSNMALHADRGADLVLGTVQPGDGLDRPVREQWDAAHPPHPGHPFVHGANLGIRADLYLRAGGFADLGAHEDRDLLRRASALVKDERVIRTARSPITTSARLVGRAAGGFADYLAALRDTTPGEQLV